MSELVIPPETEAERHLVAAFADGARGRVGSDLPDADAPEVTVRAEFLRQLLLDPDGPLGARGLRLQGARITGVLDLQGVDCRRDITLTACVCEEPLALVNARLRGLHVSGCRLKGLIADNARFSGSVYLRGESFVEGEIGLAGARIGGDLQLCGLKVAGPRQDAVFAPSLEVEGSVFLGNYPYAEGVTSLTARGTVFLASAKVGHDVFVTNTAVSLNEGAAGGFFGETEEHGTNMALSLGRARIGGILFMRDNQIGAGIVNLAGASCARFKDEPRGPGANYPIRLDGFRYGDFSRHAETGVAERLDWLDRRPADTPFSAQPYEQLAHVLRQIGHREEATRVLMEKERRLRAADLKVLKARGGLRAVWAGATVWDRVVRWTVGYGFLPQRSVVLAVALIVGLGLFYSAAWRAGDMVPDAAPILVSADWIAATESHPGNPAAFWSSPGQAGQDYETFNGFAYAADLVIPLVSLGQEAAWAPSTSRSPLGVAGWWMRWFAMGIGWIIAALVAAAVTGVIRQE